METAAWQRPEEREAFCCDKNTLDPRHWVARLVGLMPLGGRGWMRLAGGQVGNTALQVAK